MVLKRRPKDFKLAFEVVGCYCEHDGKILFLKRHDKKDYGGMWNLPAGKIKKGETPVEAIIRELEEETGIKISPKQLKRAKKYLVRYPEYDYTFETFIVLVDNKNVRIKPDEAQDHGWFTPKEALKLALVPDEDYCMIDAFKLS